jgi:hypothetical protein
MSAMEEALRLGHFVATTQPPTNSMRLVMRALNLACTHHPILRKVQLLECGCGAGAWIEFLLDNFPDLPAESIHGFDLTPALIEQAKLRMTSRLPAANLWVGDILEAASYRQPPSDAGYDLILTYDVVQQLPRRLQLLAVETMYLHLSFGGVLLIFDNDCQSAYGRKMAWKKFLTKYVGLPLVPRYYCAAHYPGLKTLVAKLCALGAVCEVLQIPETPKYAVLAHKPRTG